MIRDLSARFRKKGFEGPFYSGLKGKVRFLLESTVYRHEIVFVATPESFQVAEVPSGPLLNLHPVRAFSDLECYRAGLEEEYYPGYTEAWKDPFTWGEEAVVGTVGGRVASYNWMQFGTAEGFPTYYGRIFSGEARVLRGGVVPSFRRSGLNTLMKYRLLERFFSAGVTRVYAECYKYNVPSVRTLLRIGFRAVGVITVVDLPLGRGFVRWAPVKSVASEFQRLGISLATHANSAEIDPCSLISPVSFPQV